MVENRSFDYYNNMMGSPLAQGIFFYFLDAEHIAEKQLNYENVNTIPVTHSYSIFSVCYTPFLTRENLELEKISYDINRFQYQYDESRIGLPPGILPSVLRVKSVVSVDKNLSYTTTIKEGIEKYKVKARTPYRSYANESKLLMYPFTKIGIVDGFNSALEIVPHYIKNNSDTFDLKVRGDITPSASFTYYVDLYKNDRYGCIEGLDNMGNMEVPSLSSSYATFMANNKNKMQTGLSNNLAQSTLNTIMAVGTGFKMGGGYGAMAGLGVGLVGMGSSVLFEHKQNIASIQDATNSANTVNYRGGDVATAIGRTASKVKLYRYTLSDKIKEQIFDFFTLYGYAQNKIINVNTRNRYYFNYIKTSDINIKSSSIPHIHLEKIKQIFNQGTRIWHIDREGVVIGDYSRDNSEI